MPVGVGHLSFFIILGLSTLSGKDCGLLSQL